MGSTSRKITELTYIAILTTLLGGCFELGDPVDGNSSLFSGVRPPNSNAATVNTIPTISGTPSRVGSVGTNWSFTPNAADADGDTLTFVISNRPNWTSFDSSTGRLTGTPQSGQEGNYDNIRITVSDGISTANLTSFAVDVSSNNSNNAPTISGNAPNSAVVGQMYLFSPSANDVDGDSLSFSIANRPGWASFNNSTGQLSGIPQQGDSAVYNNIVISVSDGEMTSSLSAFSINVSQIATSAVTLNWTPPTENEDGSTLTDLAAYKIYYGLSEGNYPNEIPVNNPGLTAYIVDNLTPNTYYFVATSINSAGEESVYSNVASKVVN